MECSKSSWNRSPRRMWSFCANLRSRRATVNFQKSLKRAGRSYRKVYIHPAHHAGYYPGAEGMSLKLLFDPADGKILGYISTRLERETGKGRIPNLAVDAAKRAHCR